VKDYSK